RPFNDREHAGPDKPTGVDPGVGRTHDAAVQHAGHADVMHIDEFTGCFRRQIDAGHRLPDDGVGLYRLDLHVVCEFEADAVVGDQLAIADAAVVVAADQPVFDRELFGCEVDPFGGAR